MTIQIKDLGIQDYVKTYDAMREFNDQRVATTRDQIWLLEHLPVYTLGLSGKEEHLLNTDNIPVIKTDRGGQVTYHGPGQLIAYLMLDLKKRPYAIKKLVSLMEQVIIDYLHDLNIKAERKPGAPGVYTEGSKIAALGVRVRKGGTYHGLAINVAMDLSPFNGINPCGYANMQCTQISSFIKGITVSEVKKGLSDHLLKHLDKTRELISNVA